MQQLSLASERMGRARAQLYRIRLISTHYGCTGGKEQDIHLTHLQPTSIVAAHQVNPDWQSSGEREVGEDALCTLIPTLPPQR